MKGGGGAMRIKSPMCESSMQARANHNRMVNGGLLDRNILNTITSGMAMREIMVETADLLRE